MIQLTEAQAIALGEQSVHELMTPEEIAITQMTHDRLFMPFDVFQNSICKVFDAPIFTHTIATLRDRFVKQLQDRGLVALSYEEMAKRLAERQTSK